MTYEILEREYGDVLASYVSLEEAKQGLAEFVAESPGRESTLGLATVDDDGHAVSVRAAAELRISR
jgi:hypothetical protein